MKDSYSGAVKIGISKHPDKRVKQIQSTYNVGTVRIIKTTWFQTREEALKWEKNFHQRYRSLRSGAQGGREWFNLNNEQVNGFIDWMDASTNQRSIKVITVQAEAQKSSKEIRSDRWSAWWWGLGGSFITGIIPFIGSLITPNSPVGVFAGPVGVGVYAVSQVKKQKTLSKTYKIDGSPLGQTELKREYEIMGLWKEHVYSLDGIKSVDWKLPDKTSPEQAKRFFDRGQLK